MRRALKPAEETPLNALRLGSFLEEAGVPRGVVNIVTGFEDGRRSSSQRTPASTRSASPDLRRSGARHHRGLRRQNMKKLTLELAGKSPRRRARGRGPAATIAGVAMGFSRTRQICIAGSRVYAHRSVYEPMVEGLPALRELKVGSGLEPDARRSVRSSPRSNSIASMGLIRDGTASGAELGGRARRSRRLLRPADCARQITEHHGSCARRFSARSRRSYRSMTGGGRGSRQRHELRLAPAVWTSDVPALSLAKLIQGTVWVNRQAGS